MKRPYLIALLLLSGCSQTATINTTSPTPQLKTHKLNLTLFLPTQNGKLKATTVKHERQLPVNYVPSGEPAIELLFERAPELFPKGTRLVERISKRMPVWEVRLSHEFLDPTHPTKARLAYEALTKTAAKGISDTVKPSEPVKIIVLVDEKPVRQLGQTKITNPIDPFNPNKS